MEGIFLLIRYLTRRRRIEIAHTLSLTERQIKVRECLIRAFRSLNQFPSHLDLVPKSVRMNLKIFTISFSFSLVE